MTRGGLVICLLLATNQAVTGQVARLAPDGARIRIRLAADGGWIVGKLVRQVADTVVFQPDRGDVTRALPVRSLTELEVSVGKRYGPAAAYGALGGAVGGLGLAFLVGLGAVQTEQQDQLRSLAWIQAQTVIGLWTTTRTAICRVTRAESVASPRRG